MCSDSQFKVRHSLYYHCNHLVDLLLTPSHSCLHLPGWPVPSGGCQTFMVQGVGHKKFIKSFLLPILEKNITQEESHWAVLLIGDRVPIFTRLDLEDSLWSAPTRDKELRIKLRRKATCNKCRKEFQGITHLKLHMNNAHSDMTRAEPWISYKYSRQLDTTIPSAVHPQSV